LGVELGWSSAIDESRAGRACWVSVPLLNGIVTILVTLVTKIGAVDRRGVRKVTPLRAFRLLARNLILLISTDCPLLSLEGVHT